MQTAIFSQSVLFEEIRVFQACVVDSNNLSGMFLRMTQNGERVCFWVPRLTPAERPSSFLRSMLFRAFSRLRGLSAGRALSFLQL